MHLDDARRLTPGTSLAHRDGTRWTVTAVPTLGGDLILAELARPTGGRDYLTAYNLAEFIPEPARCVETDALDHWTCVLVTGGLPDRRVARAMKAENQAGRWRRLAAVKDRAREAGWLPAANSVDAQAAQRRALRQLEGGMAFDGRTAAARRYKQRARAGLTVAVDAASDGERVSIYDE